jgi:hypothetical protein
MVGKLYPGYPLESKEKKKKPSDGLKKAAV